MIIKLYIEETLYSILIEASIEKIDDRKSAKRLHLNNIKTDATNQLHKVRIDTRK